jgi:Na+-transporting methylmalonyl-CoA/oxaloacetate decarboxylase beta subunit
MTAAPKIVSLGAAAQIGIRVPIITVMAFLEDLIQKFMPDLSELATLQGLPEQQYPK